MEHRMPRHLERFGIDAILITEPGVTGDHLMTSLAATVGVIEATAGACSLLLRFADWGTARAAVPALTATPISHGASPPPQARIVQIPTTYDGIDLDDVAESCGLDPQQVIDRHSSAIYVVSFCGFAPGFAYLSGLPESLAVPRLSTPRPRVPAGSVAIGGTWCGIYPRATPGGWRILGRTEVAVFDPHREPIALLEPGMRVQFTRVDL